MENLISDWSMWLTMRSCMPSTVEYHNIYLRLIFKNLNISWEDFGDKEKMYGGWEKVWRLDISNNTKRKYLITMRLFADFLMSKNLISINYAREMKPPKIHKALPFAMHRDSYTHIYDAIYKRWGMGKLAKRNRMIFDMIVYTGLRREEITKVLRSDVEETKVTVREGKGGKRRVVYLPDHFSRLLRQYMEETKGESEYLFSSRTRKSITPSGVSIIFQTLKKVSGMQVYPHMLRHSYASNCIKDGVDIYTTSSQMGHSRIATTEIYLYMNDDEMYRKMQLLR